MKNESTNSISRGQQALNALVDGVRSSNLDFTVADTRFQIIDQLIVECLGWDRRYIKCERHENREFADYELGMPRRATTE